VTPKELISDSVGLLVFQQYIISATVKNKLFLFTPCQNSI